MTNITTGLLKNKTRYLLVNTKCNKSATIMFSVKVGSRDEKKGIRGISHFIEHMLFKGTTKRKDSKAISDDLYKYGAEFNAYTHCETTSYYAKIDSNHIVDAIDVLSDMLYNSKITTPDINTEKRVVISENKKNRSDPKSLIEIINICQIFKGTSYEIDTGGYDKDINAVTRNSIMKFMKLFYDPANIVITIAGNYKYSNVKMKQILNKYFGEIKSNNSINNPKIEKFLELPSTFKYKHKVRKDVSQGFISIGFPAYNMNNKNRYCLEIIKTFLCGNMSSRLFIKLREIEGLIYNIRCAYDEFSNVGSFNIILGTFGDTKSIMKCITIIIKELNDIKTNVISNDELQDAINYIVGNFKINEDSSEVASFYSELILHKNNVIKNNKITYTEDTYLSNIKNVKCKDIIEVANSLFSYNKCNICILSKQSIKAAGIRKVVRDFI